MIALYSAEKARLNNWLSDVFEGLLLPLQLSERFLRKSWPGVMLRCFTCSTEYLGSVHVHCHGWFYFSGLHICWRTLGKCSCYTMTAMRWLSFDRLSCGACDDPQPVRLPIMMTPDPWWASRVRSLFYGVAWDTLDVSGSSYILNDTFDMLHCSHSVMDKTIRVADFPNTQCNLFLFNR